MLVRSTLVVSTFCIASLAAQEPAHPPVVGRWDLTVSGGEGRHLPSWLEVHWSGDRVLVGQFVGVVGSVRPISRLDFAHDTLRWSLPPQWEGGNGDFQFTGVFAGDSLAGSLTTSDGRQLAWSGTRRVDSIQIAPADGPTVVPIHIHIDSPDGQRDVAVLSDAPVPFDPIQTDRMTIGVVQTANTRSATAL